MVKFREWRRNDLSVTIIEDEGTIYINAEYRSHPFSLVFGHSETFAPFPFYVTVQNLVGTHYSSGFQGKGLSSLLVNTGLQVLKRRFPPDSLVEGTVSDIDDPQQPELKESCHLRRIRFWQSFGFALVPREDRLPLITATLNQLKEKEGGLVLGSFPRLIPLEQFHNIPPFGFWIGL